MTGLVLNGTGLSIVGGAVSLLGGLANQIPYQTAPGVTGFITAPSVDNTSLQWTNAGGFAWATGEPASSVTIGTTTITSGTSGRVLYDNAGVLGELATTGSGNVVLATNAALVTPNLGTPSAVTLTNGTGLPISTGVSGLGAGVATLLGGASSGTGGPAGTTSPAFTTPTLGAATGTSLALGGAALGGNALAVTGTVLLNSTATLADGGTWSSSAVNLASATTLGWNADTILLRDAANALAQRNGVTAQSFRLYNTFTDATHFERGEFTWSVNANEFLIATVGGAGGGNNRTIALGPGENAALRLGAATSGTATSDTVFWVGRSNFTALDINASQASTLSGTNAQPLVTIAQGWSTTGAPNLFQVNLVSNTGPAGAAARVASFQIAGAERLGLTTLGSVLVGVPTLATNATDGFLYIASGAGTPTGVPTTQTGRVPAYIDTTNSQLWLFLGGAWKQPKTPAGAALVTWQ